VRVLRITAANASVAPQGSPMRTLFDHPKQARHYLAFPTVSLDVTPYPGPWYAFAPNRNTREICLRVTFGVTSRNRR
jgi:hypothetical protein